MAFAKVSLLANALAARTMLILLPWHVVLYEHERSQVSLRLTCVKLIHIEITLA